MQLFQNNGLSQGFSQHSHLESTGSFSECIERFLETRFAASHILAPVYLKSNTAFYTNGDSASVQLKWAKANGLQTQNLREILLAQIEHHRTEVFYNLDPMRYSSDFVARLPGCVRKKICWRAAPSGSVDLTAYDLVVSNFPKILQDWKNKGCKAAYLAPSHDPVLEDYSVKTVRNYDLVFVGGFSRHHANRTAGLMSAASTSNIKARFYLEESKFTRLANYLSFLPGVSHKSLPAIIGAIQAAPVYGRDLYQALSEARIIFNGAINMAGDDRGNMRCFEATGVGRLLLSDSGNYPDGFVDGETMVIYRSADEIPDLIRKLLRKADWTESIAAAGLAMVRDKYSKTVQWRQFQELA